MISLYSTLLLLIPSAIEANYVVLDIFSSDEECMNAGPVQASIRREVEVCYNLLPEMAAAMGPNFHHKNSYRIDSCANTALYLSASISVFDDRDCEGLGSTVSMDDMIPDECMGNMLASCQETPLAKLENWPAVEMWFPTTNDVEPDCTPSLHPPVVLSYRPGCALFKDGIAVMADCSGAGEMSLHLHTDATTCSGINSPPFWTTNVGVGTCQIAGDVFNSSPYDDIFEMWGCSVSELANLNHDQHVCWMEFLAKTSVTFKCF